jgi:hypothetical protein
VNDITPIGKVIPILLSHAGKSALMQLLERAFFYFEVLGLGFVSYCSRKGGLNKTLFIWICLTQVRGEEEENRNMIFLLSVFFCKKR